MSTTTTRDINSISAIEHEEAIELAATETARVLDLASGLSAEDWAAPTECPGWTVKDTFSHLLGMWKLHADPEERTRQQTAAAAAAHISGRLRIDELTALQVTDHASLTPAELLAQLREIAPKAVAARAALPAPVRAQPYDPQIPGEPMWTIGYLFDVINTRDPWMHRVDITRAIDKPMTLTPEHDGRLIADVVAEWARRHRQPCELTLTGSAGDKYKQGTGGPTLTIDAVEFCRILSGRGSGNGLLTITVPF